MSSTAIVLLVILGIVVGVPSILSLWMILIYNRLVKLRNRYKNAFSQIDVQLKRRYDLIPNLVETAKGFMAHEKETLEAVMKARNSAASAGMRAAANPGDAEAMHGLAGAETALNGAMGRFFTLLESYPDLKAQENIGQIMEELTSTENKIAFARQAYNDSVMHFNDKRSVFPTCFFAWILRFKEAPLFEVKSEVERDAPQVSFSA